MNRRYASAADFVWCDLTGRGCAIARGGTVTGAIAADTVLSADNLVL